MFERFTNRAQEVIGEAKKAAAQLEQNYIGTEHLLLGLVRVSDSVASKLLQEQGVTEERLEELISSLITPTGSVSVREPDGFSPEAYRVIQNSYLEAKRFHSSLVGTEHILISMLKSFDCAGTKLLNTMKVNIRQLYIELVSAKDGDVAAAREDVESLQYTRNAESKTPLLDQYSTDLTELAKEGRIDPVIGREQEINRVIQILSRRTKNNPCLIGEPGVGKTAIAEGLASRIYEGNVPDTIAGKRVVTLDMAGMVAGSKYRGEFEERMKNVINEVRNDGQTLLFIDEFHTLVDAGGADGAMNASNILKPYLARKDMTVVGATTIDEYYKHFEKDHAMNRRFSIVTLKENTKEETLEILKGIKGYYESYHQIKIDNVLLKELIELVDCHIKSRTYPDKAIDILDLSCVKAKFYHEKELTKNRIVETIEKYLNITIHHQMDYQKLEKQLNKDILGQEKGIHQMIETFQHKQLPISFFIYGPTSCGKTLTAKSLAKYLNCHYLKLDMNHYQESHSLYKLLETYHEQPSLLLSTLQSYPHTVLLLDHIDQACEEIIHLFSQILDDGYYEDQAKRKISFENVVFIMSQTCTSCCCMGFKKSRQTKYLKHELFDKVDQTIEYQPLSKEIIEKIINSTGV